MSHVHQLEHEFRSLDSIEPTSTGHTCGVTDRQIQKMLAVREPLRPQMRRLLRLQVEDGHLRRRTAVPATRAEYTTAQGRA